MEVKVNQVQMVALHQNLTPIKAKIVAIISYLKSRIFLTKVRKCSCSNRHKSKSFSNNLKQQNNSTLQLFAR